MLGGGMSSRLFQNIRERQGLAYAVFSELNLYRDSGALMVSAGTSASSAPKVVEAIVNEFRSLKQEPIPAEELRRAKDHLKGSLMLGLESTSSRMANLARQELFFGRFFSLDELTQSIETVTAEEVQEVARDSFDARHIAVTVLGRLDGVKITRDELVC
jgi:predicted Zn-dependent peptidase